MRLNRPPRKGVECTPIASILSSLEVNFSLNIEKSQASTNFVDMRARTRHELDLDVYIRRRKELLKRLKGPEDAVADERERKRPEGREETRRDGEEGRLERRIEALEEQVRVLTQHLEDLVSTSKDEAGRDQEETKGKEGAFPDGDAARPPAARTDEGRRVENEEKTSPPDTQRTPFETPTKRSERDPMPYFRKSKLASPPSFHMTEHEKTPLPLPKKKDEGPAANMEKVNSREDAVISRKTPVMASRSAPKMSELEYPPEDAPPQPPKQKKVLKKREPFDMKAKRLKSLKKQADWNRKWDRNGSMQRHKSTKWVVHNEDI